VSRLVTITIPAAEVEAFQQALGIIMERYGLSCRAAAIRYAVYKTAGLKVRMLDGLTQKIIEVK